MNNIKVFISSVAKIGISNIISLIGNVVISFLIPKMLGIEDYGFYKIFTLYVGYVSLLHFGFVDGIAIHYSGKDYAKINKQELNSEFSFFFVVEVAISILLAIIGLAFLEKYSLLFLFVAANVIIINLTSFFQLLSQAVKRFSELAFRNTLNAILQVVTIAALYAIHQLLSLSYISCIFIYTLTKFILLVWYMYTYREICIPKKTINFSNHKDEFVALFRLGLPITWSAMVANLILSLDRQFVSVLFSTSDYAVYAFAYTLFGLTLTLAQSISTILYPMLSSNTNESEICKILPKLVGAIQVLAAFLLVFYGAISLFVEALLPDYVESLKVFRIIFPGVIFNCAVSVVALSYYKYLNMGALYFRYSIITLVVAFSLNMFAYYIFNNYLSIAIASIITLLLQYILIYKKLSARTETLWLKNLLYALILTISFYLSSSIYPIMGSIIFFVAFMLCSLIFYRSYIKSIIRIVGN